MAHKHKLHVEDYMYVYAYMFVCVCVCVCVTYITSRKVFILNLETHQCIFLQKVWRRW